MSQYHSTSEHESIADFLYESEQSDVRDTEKRIDVPSGARTNNIGVRSAHATSPRTTTRHSAPHISIPEIDSGIIHFFRKISDPMARFGLFVVFFWFGALKVFDLSPATPLVQALFERMISFMPFSIFLILFGAFEMVIGLLFAIKGFEREVIPLLFVHMITTAMPLILLGSMTWIAPLVPTMEGQYIIKNLVIVASAIAVAAHIHPLSKRTLARMLP